MSDQAKLDLEAALKYFEELWNDSDHDIVEFRQAFEKFYVGWKYGIAHRDANLREEATKHAYYKIKSKMTRRMLTNIIKRVKPLLEFYNDRMEEAGDKCERFLKEIDDTLIDCDWEEE